MTTADADALVLHAGNTAERSVGRTAGRPSICRADNERVVMMVHADALEYYAERQLNSRKPRVGSKPMQMV